MPTEHVVKLTRSEMNAIYDLVVVERDELLAKVAKMPIPNTPEERASQKPHSDRLATLSNIELKLR